MEWTLQTEAAAVEFDSSSMRWASIAAGSDVVRDTDTTLRNCEWIKPNNNQYTLILTLNLQRADKSSQFKVIEFKF